MRFRTTLLLSTLVLALASPALAGIRYVNAALGTGANNGTSWADAFQGSNGLQAALAVAVPGDQVWVARGSYKPDATVSRGMSFMLSSSVEIYGGFAGTETMLSQRDFVANVTILTGDLNGDDGSGAFGDNSLHVIYSFYTGTDASPVLDGFTVRGGNANGPNGSAHQNCGGGILSLGASATVRHCVFRENRCTFLGGAGYVNGGSPTFTDCRFEWNLSDDLGGAIDSVSANPRFVRCVFSSNRAPSAGALGLVTNSGGTVTNCVFWNNTATGSGGGGAIFVGNSSPVIRQCIVAANHADMHSSAGIRASPPIGLANDIFYFNQGLGAQGVWHNVEGGICTSCCVQGISPGAGNISSDPLIVSLATGDLHLRATSPCADAGNNAALPPGTTTDLDGNPRLADDTFVPDTGVGPGPPIVDIGAYEIRNSLYAPFCAGDGSLGTVCPCGNDSATAGGRGCLNSDIFSPGALLTAVGLSNPDTVVLTSSEMLPSVTCIFLQGDQQNPNGVVFGDGVRCVAGSLKRLFLKTATLGTASAPGPGDSSVSARSAALGDPIAPGTQRYYQVYYRDSNLAFCSAPQGDSWNVTSGLIIYW